MRATSSGAVLICSCSQTAGESGVCGPRPSAAKTTALRTAEPMAQALPSSPISQPQPPARADSPLELQPQASEPVPAMSATPVPVPEPADSRGTASLTTRTLCASRASSAHRRMTPRSESRSAPASPRQAAATVQRGIAASSKAEWTARSRFCMASTGPTARWLEGPAYAVARI